MAGAEEASKPARAAITAQDLEANPDMSRLSTTLIQPLLDSRAEHWQFGPKIIADAKICRTSKRLELFVTVAVPADASLYRKILAAAGLLAGDILHWKIPLQRCVLTLEFLDHGNVTTVSSVQVALDQSRALSQVVREKADPKTLLQAVDVLAAASGKIEE
jgi:hypothetical protein